MRLSLKTNRLINPATITFSVVLAVLLLFSWGVPILDQFELKTYDLRCASRKPRGPQAPVALAVVDEKSLDALGRWPWPRSTIARLVDSLSGHGARVIGFDMGFLEPDAHSAEMIALIEQTIAQVYLDLPMLADVLRRRLQAGDNDQVLAQSIARSPAAVVLGYFFHMDGADTQAGLTAGHIAARLDLLDQSKYPLVMVADPNAAENVFIKAHAPECNLESLSRHAAAAGYFTLSSDIDGVVRWAPVIIQCGQDIFQPLSVLCAWHYLDKPRMMVQVDRFGVQGIHIGEGFIPTDESGRLLINYLGPPKTFPHYSISDILAGRVDREAFFGKIVLVGATANGIYDMRSTPLAPVYPGAEIHATIIDNILSQDFMSKPRWAGAYDVVAILLLGLMTGLVLPRTGAAKGLLFAAALFAAHIAAAQWLFGNTRVWLNIIYPLLVLSLNYTGITVYHYLTEERERKKIKGAFRQYVAPLVIEKMLQEPDRFKLGGEVKELTVLFSDLEKFTSYSEKYAPEQMTQFLSEYFEKMTEQIFARQGTLKEYVGDELMAIFGAPLDHPDHARKACATALAMQAARREMRAEWQKMGRPPLKARTGINSGNMLVGNLGCRYRFAYGALGDQVNLGSRLEGMNKFYGTRILIGENTERLVRGDFVLREVDMVRVVGRNQCVAIFELIAHRDEWLPPEKQKALDLYRQGLEAYRMQRWAEAMGAFEACFALSSGDGPSQTLIERCRHYQSTPPPEDWDCVYEALSK
jgi:adenylate cyclase